MLYSLNALAQCQLATPDQATAALREIYVDERRWVVRHLVAEVGTADAARWVLVPPTTVRGVDAGARRIDLAWGGDQLSHAPGAQTDPPQGRTPSTVLQYGPPWDRVLRWGLPDLPLGGVLTSFMLPDEAAAYAHPRTFVSAVQYGQAADPHLHGSADLIGCAVAAQDGNLGFVHDLLLDGPLQHIELVVVDTCDWLPRRLVLVPPRWVSRIDLDRAELVFRVSRKAIETSPALSLDTPPGHAEVLAVQRHFESWL